MKNQDACDQSVEMNFGSETLLDKSITCWW